MSIVVLVFMTSVCCYDVEHLKFVQVSEALSRLTTAVTQEAKIKSTDINRTAKFCILWAFIPTSHSYCLCLQRMCSLVWGFVNSTYHSSVEYGQLGYTYIC